MSNRATSLGILLTTLIMSCVASVSIAQETSDQPHSIYSGIATEYEADCRVLLDYQKFFANHISVSKAIVKDIKQTINDVAADRGCFGSSQSNSYPSTKSKADKLKPEVDSSLEKKK